MRTLLGDLRHRGGLSLLALLALRGVIPRMRTNLLPPGPGCACRARIMPLENPFTAAPDSNLRRVAAFGFRNPFCSQIDTATGALMAADVGESLREEFDLLAAPVLSSTGPRPEPPDSVLISAGRTSRAGRSGRSRGHSCRHRRSPQRRSGLLGRCRLPWARPAGGER